jgi:hypothetical protein
MSMLLAAFRYVNGTLFRFDGLSVAAAAEEFSTLSTVQGYFYDWSQEGRFASINHLLVMQAREAAGREASPSPISENPHTKARKNAISKPRFGQYSLLQVL